MLYFQHIRFGVWKLCNSLKCSIYLWRSMSHSGDELGFFQKLNYLRVSQFMKNENKIYLKTWTKGNQLRQTIV